MAQFNCQGCGKTISVPDQYAGKKVRCPGCQAAQRVPLAEAPRGDQVDLALDTPLDLSALDATDGGSGVRRLRRIVIGCGACRKNIRVPESKLGGTMPCPKCGVVLRVDPFDLSKAKGDLIDMTHLELDKADLLLDGGPHGSTLGGSAIQLDSGGSSGGSAMGTGYGSTRAPSGSMSGVAYTDSQTQMSELRELNELKHSGQISNAEYRQRKAQIYGGKTLAIQALSRSADGDGNRPVIKADGSSALLPMPVMLLLGVLVLGVAGFGAWSLLNGSTIPNPNNGGTATGPDDTGTASPEVVAVDGGAEDPATPPDPADPDSSDAGDPAGVTDDMSPPPDGQTDPATPTYPVTMFEAPIASGPGGIGQPTPPVESAVAMQIASWPVEWPDHDLSNNEREAIGKACQVVKRMTYRNESALIGTAVGPPAADLDDPAYQNFRAKMQAILTDTAAADQVLDDLNFRTSERTAPLGSLECHRLHVTSRSNTSVRVTILTGLQDGYCVTYWFTGDKSLYARFVDTVGTATLAPIR